MKIIIYGATELGCLLATEFFEDHDITIIDKEENRTEEFDKLDISYIYGNAASIDILKTAEIEDADIFIAATNLDEANIVACLMVKKISTAKTVCFVTKEEYKKSLIPSKYSEFQSDFLIDYVIWPEELLTHEIFRLITVSEALDVQNFANGKTRLLEYKIKENSQLLNKKIKDCSFMEGVLIVGITRNHDLFIPDGETVLTLDDKVIFIGLVDSLNILAGKFFHEKDNLKSVAIIGGGNVGLMLAQSLEKIKIKTKIIEKNYDRCEVLSEELSNTLIINADGTDLEALEQEEIGNMDAVIAVTNNDERNLLCSLLAKQLGIKRIITRVSKSLNIPLFQKVGIDIAVSPKGASIKEVRNQLIEKDVDILATVEQGQGEVLEITVGENFKNVKLMDLKIPEKGIIAVIRRRNKVIIPKGNSLINEGDDIIVFTEEENAQKIKEFFRK